MRRNSIKYLVVGLFLFGFVLPSAVAVSLTDISGHKYEPAIQGLVDLGVINGYPDGSYKPDITVNRAEFLKIVIGASVDNVGSKTNCFPDVKDEWFARYVCYAKDKGIVQGYSDNYFRPAQTINYVEALKVIYRTNNDAGTPGGDAWYSPYTDDAEEYGIALYNLNYSQLLRRGEIAQLMWNYLDVKSANNDIGVIAPPVVEEPVTTPPIVSPPSTGSSKTGVDMAACDAGQISGNALYVSTNGNDDSGDGSIGAPFRTVSAALGSVSAGDSIVLRGGTYNEPNELRIRVQNVTLRSYPGEWAVIDRRSDTEDAGVYFYVGSDGGKLQCVEVVGGFYVFSTETMWDWGEPDRSGASNILIENTKLHGSLRDVVKIKPNSDNITIRNNEIYDSGHGDTPGDCNAEGIDNVNGDNTKVQNNHIHDICSTGVYLKGGATNGLIEGNIIENVGAAGILVGFDTSPEYFDLGVNPGYYENIGGIVRNNLIRNTEWAGIGFYAAKNAQAYNNTIINAAQTYHGPIYFGVTFQDWEPEAGRPANVNITVKDNVISQGSGIDSPMVGIRYTEDLGGLSGLSGNPIMSGNCYYQAGGSARFEDGRSQVDMGGWTQDWSGGLSEWMTHISGDSGSVEVDPQLDSNNRPQNAACTGKGYTS